MIWSAETQRIEYLTIGIAADFHKKPATYDQIRDYVWEHYQLKVSNLYIAQVKQKYGIIERENYHKAKNENAKQPQCPKEKEDAIVEALKHFQMI